MSPGQEKAETPPAAPNYQILKAAVDAVGNVFDVLSPFDKKMRRRILNAVSILMMDEGSPE